MKKEKQNPLFIGRVPDSSDYFSNFFFSLKKEQQLEYLKYLEDDSIKRGLKTATLLFVIFFIFLVLILGSLFGWYPNDY